LIALATREHLADGTVATSGADDPGAIGPRWIVAHMLVVPTLELSDPMLLVVLVKADDALTHEV
jgi:hypothetical protein